MSDRIYTVRELDYAGFDPLNPYHAAWLANVLMKHTCELKPLAPKEAALAWVWAELLPSFRQWRDMARPFRNAEST